MLKILVQAILVVVYIAYTNASPAVARPDNVNTQLAGGSAVNPASNLATAVSSRSLRGNDDKDVVTGKDNLDTQGEERLMRINRFFIPMGRKGLEMTKSTYIKLCAQLLDYVASVAIRQKRSPLSIRQDAQKAGFNPKGAEMLAKAVEKKLAKMGQALDA